MEKSQQQQQCDSNDPNIQHYMQGYNRGLQMGANLFKMATNVVQSTAFVIGEGVKSFNETVQADHSNLYESQSSTNEQDQQINQNNQQNSNSYSSLLNGQKCLDFATSASSTIGHIVGEGVKSVQGVLTNNTESTEQIRTMAASTVATTGELVNNATRKTAEIVGEIVGGTVQLINEVKAGVSTSHATATPKE